MTVCLRKPVLIFLFSGLLIFALPLQKAQAMEPVSITMLAIILAPYAIQAAQYTAKGLARTVPCWINQGAELLNIFKLPLGLIQSTLGLPFGYVWDGLQNIWTGTIAPFMFLKEFFSLPMYFFGYK